MGDARVILQSATMNFNPFRSTSSVVSSNSPQSPRSQPLPLQFSASRSTQVVRDCHGNYDLEDTTRVASNSGTSTSISTGSVTAAVATNATIASPSRSPGPMAPLSAPLAWLSGWGATSFSSSSAGKQNHSHHQFSTNSYASQNHGGGHPLIITDNHQKPASSSQRAALTPTTIGTTTSPRSALPPPPIMHSIDSSHPNPNPSAAGPNLNNAAFTSPPPRASMITNNVNNRAPIPTSLTMLRGTESHESDDEENRLQNLINNSFDDDRGTTMPSITSMMSAVILGPEKTMKKQQQQRQEKMAREGISRVERVDVYGGEIVNNFQNSTYSQHHYNHQLRQPQLQTGHNRQMHPQQHSMAVAISTDKLNSIAPDSGNIEDRAETQYAADENHPKPIGSSSKNADTKAADSVSSVSPIHPRHHQQQQTNHKQHHYPKESNTTFPGFALFEMAKVQYCLGKYSKALDTTTECLAFQKLALERMEKNSSSTGNIGSDNFSAISNEFAQIGSAHGANSGISGLHASASAYVSANWSASGGMPHPDNRYCSTMTPNPNHHPSSRISSLGGTNAKVTTTIGRDVSHDGFGSSVRNLGMGVVRSLKGSGSGSFYGSAGSSSIAVGNSANGTAGTVGGSGNSANVGTVVGVAGGTSSLPMASRAPLPSVTINKNASDIRINHPLPHSIMANTTTMMISHYPTHSCIAQTLLLRGRVLAECGVYGCHDDDEDGSGNASGGNGGGGGGDTDFLLLLQAIRHVEMAVAIQRRITIESNANEDLSRWQLTTPLVFLGVMRAQLANFEEADMAYEEALSILRSVKKREREDLLAAKRRGDVESVKECESCIRQIDSEIAHVLCLLGRSHHCRRSYEKAFDCYNRGLRLHKRVGSTKKNGSVRGIRRCMKDKGALEKLVSGYWDDRSTI